jgi:hypothetical protein
MTLDTVITEGDGSGLISLDDIGRKSAAWRRSQTALIRHLRVEAKRLAESLKKLEQMADAAEREPKEAQK